MIVLLRIITTLLHIIMVIMSSLLRIIDWGNFQVLVYTAYIFLKKCRIQFMAVIWPFRSYLGPYDSYTRYKLWNTVHLNRGIIVFRDWFSMITMIVVLWRKRVGSIAPGAPEAWKISTGYTKYMTNHTKIYQGCTRYILDTTWHIPGIYHGYATHNHFNIGNS